MRTYLHYILYFSLNCNNAGSCLRKCFEMPVSILYCLNVQEDATSSPKAPEILPPTQMTMKANREARVAEIYEKMATLNFKDIHLITDTNEEATRKYLNVLLSESNSDKFKAKFNKNKEKFTDDIISAYFAKVHALHTENQKRAAVEYNEAIQKLNSVLRDIGYIATHVEHDGRFERTKYTLPNK